MRQLTLAARLGFEKYSKQTRREQFLSSSGSCLGRSWSR